MTVRSSWLDSSPLREIAPAASVRPLPRDRTPRKFVVPEWRSKNPF